MRRALSFLVLLIAVTGRAELPTSAYYDLEQSATEAVRITVQDVRVSLVGEGWERVQWRARVDRVIRSKTGLKAGTVIRFEVTQPVASAMVPGPARAPHLRRGQRTIAFLNRDKKGVITLAKHGRSFEVTPKPKQ